MRYGCKAAVSLLVLIESFVLCITCRPKGAFIGVGVRLVVLNLAKEGLYRGRSNFLVLYLMADLGFINIIFVLRLSKLLVIPIFLDPSR